MQLHFSITQLGSNASIWFKIPLNTLRVLPGGTGDNPRDLLLSAGCEPFFTARPCPVLCYVSSDAETNVGERLQE